MATAVDELKQRTNKKLLGWSTDVAISKCDSKHEKNEGKTLKLPKKTLYGMLDGNF